MYFPVIRYDKYAGGFIRWDKSTLNGAENKLYAFPRESLALNIANFDFWNVGAITQLKPHISFGATSSPVGFGSTFTSLGGTNIVVLLGSTVSSQIGNTKPNQNYKTPLEYIPSAFFYILRKITNNETAIFTRLLCFATIFYSCYGKCTDEIFSYQTGMAGKNTLLFGTTK